MVADRDFAVHAVQLHVITDQRVLEVALPHVRVEPDNGVAELGVFDHAARADRHIRAYA